MSNLDRIWDVTISRSTTSASVAGFGIILVVGENPAVRSKSYSSLVDVGVDFDDDDPEYRAAAAIFGQLNAPASIVIGLEDTGESFAQALAAIAAVDNTWYYVVRATSELADADIAAASSWLTANKKFCILGTADANVLTETAGVDVTSVPALMNAAAFVKGACIYNSLIRTATVGSEALGYADAAFASALAVRTPGSYTTDYINLAAVTPDVIDGAGVTNALAKNCNFYHTVAGLNFTEEGRTTDGNALGEWIDTMVGVDWLEARVQEAMITLFYNATQRGEKITYTDKGISALEGECRGIMDLAVDNDFLSGYTITAAKAADQTTADKAARTFNGLVINGTLAGAIQTGSVNINLVY